MTDRVRITLDLSKRHNDFIERLALEHETSKADVLRYAVEFLSACDRAKENGFTVGAWSDNPRIEREFIGL